MMANTIEQPKSKEATLSAFFYGDYLLHLTDHLQ
jgi:hypothetical protein